MGEWENLKMWEFENLKMIEFENELVGEGEMVGN